MRWLAIVLVLTAIAHADEVALVGVFGDATHLGGIQAGGVGVDGELAEQRGRTAVFAEAAVAWLAVGVLSAAQTGIHGRVGAGARWIPATFGDATGGFDLYVEAGAGATGYGWSGGHVLRPDVTLGWGVHIRTSRRGGLRFGLRAMLAHDTSGLAAACRGCVVSRPQTVDGGLLAVMGWSW